MKLLTIDQVAETLNVSAKSVYRLVHAGKLTMVKIGRASRIPEDALQRYLHSIGCRGC